MKRAALVLLCGCHGLYGEYEPPPPAPMLEASTGMVAGAEDESAALSSMLLHDTIPDRTTTLLHVVTPPLHGTLHAGTYASDPGTYEPFTGFNGMDAFTYELEDSDGNTVTADALVTIAADEVPYEQARVIDTVPLYGLVADDLDGDRKPEIVTTDGTVVRVYQPANSFAVVELPAGTAPHAVILADIDGDTRPDIVAVGSDGIVILRNHSNGGPLTFDAPVVLPAGNAYAVTTGDLDQDGKLDLISVDADANTLDVFLNRSVPDQLAFEARASFPTATRPIAVLSLQIDDTGGGDVVVLSAGSHQLSIFMNTMPFGGSIPTFAPRVDRTTGTSPLQLIATWLTSGYTQLVVPDADSGLWVYAYASQTYVDANVYTVPYTRATTFGMVSLTSSYTDFIAAYDGHLGQVITQDLQQQSLATRDMTVGRADTGAPFTPQAVTGIVQVDLDGVAPAEVVVASELGLAVLSD